MKPRLLLTLAWLLTFPYTGAAQTPATLTFANPTGQPSTVDIYLSTPTPVAGFQFTVTGATITNATGGAAAAAGIQVVFGTTGVVLGYSLTLATIPPTPGAFLTRLQVTPTGGPICMSAPVLSDVSGFAIPVTAGPCTAVPSLSAGPATVGGSLTVSLSSPAEPGAPYICGFATATTPGIPIPDGRVVPLANDFLLQLSTDPTNPIFLNTNGNLDAAGSSVVTAIIPPTPGLSGFTAHVAFVTISPQGALSGISPPLIVTVQ